MGCAVAFNHCQGPILPDRSLTVPPPLNTYAAGQCHPCPISTIRRIASTRTEVSPWVRTIVVEPGWNYDSRLTAFAKHDRTGSAMKLIPRQKIWLTIIIVANLALWIIPSDVVEQIARDRHVLLGRYSRAHFSGIVGLLVFSVISFYVD